MKEAKESGEPVVDRKPAAAITDDQDDDIAGAVIEDRQHGKQQSRQRVCRDGKAKSGQPCFVMEEAGSSRDHHLRARSDVSASRKRGVLDPRCTPAQQ